MDFGYYRPLSFASRKCSELGGVFLKYGYERMTGGGFYGVCHRGTKNRRSSDIYSDTSWVRVIFYCLLFMNDTGFALTFARVQVIKAYPPFMSNAELADRLNNKEGAILPLLLYIWER